MEINPGKPIIAVFMIPPQKKVSYVLSRLGLLAVSVCIVGLVAADVCPVVGFQQENREASRKVTLCDLYKDPARYAGLIISLRAHVNPYGGYGNRELSRPSFERQNECSDGYLNVGLEYPSEVKPRPDFELLKDSAYAEYEMASRKGMAIDATLEGRFDVTFVWRAKQKIRVGTGDGFGKQKLQDARLVLRRISSVIAMPLPRR